MSLVNISMLNLEEGVETPFQYYEQVVKTKRNGKKILLYGEHTDGTTNYSNLYHIIKERYTEYESHLNTLEMLSIKEYSPAEEEALIHCYNGTTKALKNIKEKIIQSQNSFYQTHCSYCGISESHYLDHYMPKSLFPDYAIHAYNLIPCCSYCNEKKSDSFLDSRNQRIFFNPYTDSGKDEKLKMEIKYNRDTNTPLIGIELIDQNYARHINRLEIKKRYIQEGIHLLENEIYEARSSFANFSKNYSNLKEYENIYQNIIIKKAKKRESDRGINSVESIFYRGFIKSSYFDLKFLIEKFGNNEEIMILQQLN